MARIRELQPAHKSDKVTVSEAARAFKNVQKSSPKVTRDAETGRMLTQKSGSSKRRNNPDR